MNVTFESRIRDHSHRSRFVEFAAIAYVLLVIYASLHPFAGWRSPSDHWFSFFFEPWPRYYSLSDVYLNILGYLPVGFAVGLVASSRVRATYSVLIAVILGVVLSSALEVLQAALSTRVASNLDLLSNGLGALAGALLAITFGKAFLFSGELLNLRRHWFMPGAAIDLGFLILLLWLFTQLNPELWLFGTGDLRYLIPSPSYLPYDPQSYRWVEAGVAALSLSGVALLVSSLAQPGRSTAAPLLILVSVALILKSAAASTLFNPGDAALWLTPGSLLGIPLGIVVYLAFSRLPNKLICIAGGLVLMSEVALLNLAPVNPYVQAAIQVWRYGHFLSFYGTTRLVSTLWPFIAIAYLLWRTFSASRHT